MTKENIYEIRIEWIAKIKEKVKKNPMYTHPCNRERQDDIKTLEFESGSRFIYWMQQNGILKNPGNINREHYQKTAKNAGCKTWKEYIDKCAQNLGFKDHQKRYVDHNRERSHEIGRYLPKEFNEYCPSWFGEFISQNYVMRTFEDPIKMPQNNPGFDWLCKRGEKIDHKGCCTTKLNSNGTTGWEYGIRHNNIADYFILSAWDNRDSLNPLHVWIFHKNDIVRERKFCKFENFGVTNTQEKLKELEKYEVTDRLDKLRELCNRRKEN